MMKKWYSMLFALPVIAAQLQMGSPPANCILPAKPGPCKAGITNHFYNTTSGQCETFLFGGCGGNDNRFQSKEDCERRCSCHMPPDPGSCLASKERWYYNRQDGCCERFTYGGCGGNGNNFETKQACEKTCAWSVPGKQKPLGIEWGSGYDRRKGEIVYKNYGQTYGGSGTIWLHNEIETMKSPPKEGSRIMGIIRGTGRRQVPGVQTKLNYQMILGDQAGGQRQSQSGGSWRVQGQSSGGSVSSGGAGMSGGFFSTGGAGTSGGSTGASSSVMSSGSTGSGGAVMSGGSASMSGAGMTSGSSGLSNSGTSGVSGSMGGAGMSGGGGGGFVSRSSFSTGGQGGIQLQPGTGPGDGIMNIQV